MAKGNILVLLTVCIILASAFLPSRCNAIQVENVDNNLEMVFSNDMVQIPSKHDKVSRLSAGMRQLNTYGWSREKFDALHLSLIEKFHGQPCPRVVDPRKAYADMTELELVCVKLVDFIGSVYEMERSEYEKAQTRP